VDRRSAQKVTSQKRRLQHAGQSLSADELDLSLDDLELGLGELSDEELTADNPASTAGEAEACSRKRRLALLEESDDE
jgi:hypothetical protein